MYHVGNSLISWTTGGATVKPENGTLVLMSRKLTLKNPPGPRVRVTHYPLFTQSKC